MSTDRKCEKCEKPTTNLKTKYFFEEGNFHPHYRLHCDECKTISCPNCGKSAQEDLKIIKRCLKCEKNRLKAHLESIITSFKFQIQFQYCQNCGKPNDSRNEDGSINKRYCTKCRKAFGEHVRETLRNSHARERELKGDLSQEKTSVVFDKTFGFIQKK